MGGSCDINGTNQPKAFKRTWRNSDAAQKGHSWKVKCSFVDKQNRIKNALILSYEEETTENTNNTELGSYYFFLKLAQWITEAVKFNMCVKGIDNMC